MAVAVGTKTLGSLESGEPLHARSERALTMMNIILCWWQKRATEWCSISTGVSSNLEKRKSLYAATVRVRGGHKVEFAPQSSFSPW